MTIIKLRHIDRFRDRHGRWRYYFRRDHGARIPLLGIPGSPQFMWSYQRALGQESRTQTEPEKDAPRTTNKLVKEYFESSQFAQLSENSQRHYRYIIERWVMEENIGHRLVAEMTCIHIDRMIAKRAATPGIANNMLSKIRVLIHFAIGRRWRSDDPTSSIKKFTLGTIHTWTDEEISAYEERWPIGTAERTAFALFLHTSQRVSDVARMVWADIKSGRIDVVPRKTERKTRTKLSIPLHPDLEQILRSRPRNHLSILTSASGAPFTARSLGVWMAGNIELAGLPERCVPHGLRKAAARLLAEAGCSVKEIQAITGHASLSEIERYTRAAEQSRLADSALARLTGHKRNTSSQT